MKGIALHPLRIAALDRMSVLRVPFKVQPKKEAALIDRELLDTKGIWQTWLRNPDGGIDQDFNAQYLKPPYAPGDYFVKETCYICRSADDGEALCDPPVVYAADGAKKNDEYPFVRTARVMPSWAARHYLTLGPPVPCRLGEVDVVQQRDEGVIIEIGDEYRRTWDALYPKHPFSPDRWTWGYPMEVRKR